MLIFALDDERLLLERLQESIEEAVPDAEVMAFRRSSEALKKLEEGAAPDIAFLDIEMPGISGLELAKAIKELSPKTNLVFVTAFSQYALEAFPLFPSGYVMKPITRKKIAEQMKHLRQPVSKIVEPDSGKCIRVQCFGNFAVLIHGELLPFKRSKAQEVFAYLVHKRGTTCSMQEIAAVLFEDEPYDGKTRDYVRKLVNDMIHTFKEVGIDGLFSKQYNKITLHTELIDCDYYRFLNLDLSAINAYTGEYMNQYGWAMFVVGYLDEKRN